MPCPSKQGSDRHQRSGPGKFSKLHKGGFVQLRSLPAPYDHLNTLQYAALEMRREQNSAIVSGRTVGQIIIGLAITTIKLACIVVVCYYQGLKKFILFLRINLRDLLITIK